MCCFVLLQPLWDPCCSSDRRRLKHTSSSTPLHVLLQLSEILLLDITVATSLMASRAFLKVSFFKNSPRLPRYKFNPPFPLSTVCIFLYFSSSAFTIMSYSFYFIYLLYILFPKLECKAVNFWLVYLNDSQLLLGP